MKCRHQKQILMITGQVQTNGDNMNTRDLAIKVKSQELLINYKGDDATEDDYRLLRELRMQYYDATGELANSKY